MKVGYLIANFPTLSETFVANEIDRLEGLGMDIRIFAFLKPPPDDIDKLSPSCKRLMDKTVYLGSVDLMSAALKRPLLLARSWRENARLQAATSIKPNAVVRLLRAASVAQQLEAQGIHHLHAHWPYASQIAYLVNAISRVSFSISVHAHEVAHDSGHFPIVFQNASFAAFCNRGAMNYLLQRLPAEAERRAHLVYHGVDLQRFVALAHPDVPHPLSILSSGRLTSTKGFDRLIRACAAARAAGTNVRLTILGRGPMESELKRLAAELDFSDRLSMPGWVAQESVARFMQEAHVFALLADTEFHDGLPNVVLEAMASGRPVILSPLPAASEAVTSGQEGFVLPDAQDVHGFVDILKRFAAEPQLATTMGQAARRRVEIEHDARVQIVGMFRLLERCV